MKRTIYLLSIILIGFLPFQTLNAQDNPTIDIQTDTILITNLEDSTVHKFAETLPEYPGGMEKLFQYLSKNVRYPENCRKKMISGVVLSEFIVEKDGSISNIKVIVSADPDLDAEAIRVISSFPKWIPGTQQGKPVRVFFQLPIRFTVS
jgi:TonB family protein